MVCGYIVLQLLTATILVQHSAWAENVTRPIETVPPADWADEIAEWEPTIEQREDFAVNTAMFTVKSLLTDRQIGIYMQHQQCFGCETQLKSVIPRNGNASLLEQSSYNNIVEIADMSQQPAHSLICGSELDSFGERGDYWLIVHVDNVTSQITCDLVLNNDPENYNLPVLYAFLVLFGLAILWLIARRIYKSDSCQDRLGITREKHTLPSSPGQMEMSGSTTTVTSRITFISDVDMVVNAPTLGSIEMAPEPPTSNGAVENHVEKPPAYNEAVKKSFDDTADTLPSQVAPNGNVSTVLEQSTTNETETQERTPEPPKRKQRLRSLDAFRGFSLTVMIFVNYGGGAYWYFQHAHWDGLLVADLVMPWFVWIMGVSITFAFRSMLKKGKSKWRIFFKVLERSIKIFAIGLFMGARDSPDVKKMRIPGVLQRLALTYFITACVHLVFVRKDRPPEEWGRHRRYYRALSDVLDYWKEWVVMFGILATQVALTYALPVPGCPTGYVGPGGLHEGGEYYNCTGGAAGYIDRVVLGENHIYQWPTIQELYRTPLPYDPEGILGTLTSVFMCFLGLQAGKIITTHKSHGSRIRRWLVWGIITGAIGAILCQGKQTYGWMPLNKNLWSVSFIMALSGMAFIVLIIFYCVIDVAKIWNGAPFIYPGMNSIVVYVCHSVFGGYFPVAWQWPDYSLHWQRLFAAAWGTTVWVVVSYAMYRKKVFVAL